MPILDEEIDIYPANLLDIATEELRRSDEKKWFAMYTLARYEKKLMRQLLTQNIAYYGPVVGKRYRAPNGRIRTSHIPLFSNYVFVWGTEEDRFKAVSTGSVSRWLGVGEGEKLCTDLQQIYRLIATGAPVTPEARLEAGDKVRVRTGAFAGFYGVVTKRAGETRLNVFVDFMGQGASVQLDDCQLDPI